MKIENCVQLSRAIEHGLDREEEDFELEVSSAGLDTPFTVRQQYLKNIGKNVVIHQTNGTKSEGKLIETNENDFVVEYRKREKVEGKKKKAAVNGEAKFHCLERNFGKFRRIIEIPKAGDTRNIKGEYVQGILRVRLPKIEDRRGQKRKVPIN